MLHKRTGLCFSLFSIVLCIAWFATVGASSTPEEADVWRCPRCPFCSVGGVSFRMRLRYCYLSKLFTSSREMPFATDAAVSRVAMSNLEELLRLHILGQRHITGAIARALRRKFSQPREPLIFHFTGDNGVGKTHTARLISLATSLRCARGRTRCDAGDNLLVIAATGYDGLAVEEARRRIVSRINAHQRKFPHGVVLVDDLAAMRPALVAALAPLFGRAERFEEENENENEKDENENENERAPGLGQLTVIVTTDFGREGRTQGKSVETIEQMTRETFAELYGTLVPLYTRTMVFLPFTRRIAEKVVRNAVAAMPCERFGPFGEESPHAPAGSRIDDLAVAFIVERYRNVWEGRENGHALRRAVEDMLLPLVLRYFDENGYDRKLWARFRLDEEDAQIVLEARSDLDDAVIVVAPKSLIAKEKTQAQNAPGNLSESTWEAGEKLGDL